MKISELIAKLQDILEKEGDLVVVLNGEYEQVFSESNLEVSGERIWNVINNVTLAEVKHLSIVL